MDPWRVQAETRPRHRRSGRGWSAPRHPVLDAYRNSPRSGRLHVAVRWTSAPLRTVAAALPSRGRVLDVGCGHGVLSLLAASGHPHRQLFGVDIDPDKIAEARLAAAALASARTPGPGSGPVQFDAVAPGWQPQPGEGWDAIVICDVLYLLGPAAGCALLEACAEALGPGGVLVVKEIGHQPRWKYGLAVLQELAATRLVGVTAGATVRFLRPQQLIDTMERAGLVVQSRRIDRRYPHPHLLVVGTAS